MSVCYQHERCVYDGLSTDEQLNFQSAGIALGLLPTLISSLGISITEVALLSAHRPFLSLLLSLAAPAVWPLRIFDYNDPAHLLAPGPGRVEMQRLGPWAARALSLCEYVLAIAAVVSNFVLSWDMGNKTILSWGCTMTFGPLLWMSLPLVLHIPSALSYGIIAWQARKREKEQEDSRCWWNRWLSVLQAEFTICANQMAPCFLSPGEKVPITAVLLHIFAGCASFVHLVFGMILFSSLLFISVWDVLSSILWRLVLATVVARVILIIEMAGLRASHSNSVLELIK